jgi:methyl-accepting chemotaxis protein
VYPASNGSDTDQPVAVHHRVERAADDVSRNVSTLSAGSEQMSASIRGISMNASEAAQVATTAVGIAATARDTVADLSKAPVDRSYSLSSFSPASSAYGRRR